VSKRGQRGNREDGIETLFEGLHLQLNSLVESEMEYHVDIVLCVFKNDVSVLASLNELDLIIARQSEGERVVFNSAAICDCYTLELTVLHLFTQLFSDCLFLYFCSSIGNYLELGKSAENRVIKFLEIKDAHLAANAESPEER